jgi:phospholipase/carboxylesterase
MSGSDRQERSEEQTVEAMNENRPFDGKVLDCLEINPGGEPRASVLWLHGLGADGHDFEPIVHELRLPESLPLRFVFPHAPERSVTINAGMVMRAWYDVYPPSFSKEIDMEGIIESSVLLRTLIARELHLGFPPERILLAGFSQGGAIALHTGLTYEKRLAGIMGLSTYLPSLEEVMKARTAANKDIPILMAHGRMDPMISMTKALQTRQALKRLGYSIRWQEYPMQHEVCREEINDIRTWLIEVLGSKAAPKSGNLQEPML